MSIPPCLMRLKIANSEHNINLWLPLFIAWIIMLILAIALAPVVLFLALVFWPLDWGKFLWRIGPAFYKVLCALKGLSVDIQSRDKVTIYFR